MRALRGLPPLGSSGYVSVDAIADNSGVSDVDISDADFGAGSIDGVSNLGVSNLGVSTETIGGNTGLSGEEFDDIGLVNTTGGGGVSANVTGTDFDFGMGSDDGVGTSSGEGDVGITIDPYDNPYAIDITDTNIYTENPDGTYTVEDGEPDPIEIGGDGEGEPPANGSDTADDNNNNRHIAIFI